MAHNLVFVVQSDFNFAEKAKSPASSLAKITSKVVCSSTLEQARKNVCLVGQFHEWNLYCGQMAKKVASYFLIHICALVCTVDMIENANLSRRKSFYAFFDKMNNEVFFTHFFIRIPIPQAS